MPVEKDFEISRRQFLWTSTALAGASTFPSTFPGWDLYGQQRKGTVRNLLARSCSEVKLRASLLPQASYRPFPAIQERAAWKSLRPETKTGMLARGEKYLRWQWPALPAVSFLEYARTGDRAGYESLRSARMAALQALLFAECVEDQGRFLDDLVNGIWATCEESFWGVPAHLYLQKTQTALPDPQDPVVDLFAAQTSALLATTVYLLNTRLDAASPVIRERVSIEAEHRILKPLLARDFAWMGLRGASGNAPAVNNWNPWISWNWLTTSLLLEKDEDRRRQSVAKALACLDVFINSYPEDGGCDEGPTYWNVAAGAMFDALELMFSATAGAVDIFSDPLIAEMAAYINRVHIAGRYFLNPGDASPLIQLDVDKVFRFGRRVKNQDLVSLATSSIPASYLPDSLPAIFNETMMRAAPAPGAVLLRDVWLPDTRLMAARVRSHSVAGFYLGCIAANNGKSHSHNDTGSFWIYSHGLPVVIDLGQETYTKNSFGPHRYDIHSTQSAYHNLPTIGGVQQGAGAAYAASEIAYETQEDLAQLAMELKTAYPASAKLKSWRRVLRLDRRSNHVEVEDSYTLIEPVAEIVLSLMTPSAVTPDGNGRLLLTSPAGAPPTVIAFDAQQLAASVETIALENAELQKNWGSHIFRILLTATAPVAAGKFTLKISGT